MRSPYTEKEQEVMDHLEKAWNAYIELPSEHPDELDEFRHAIHRIQDSMSTRVLRREYRSYFATIKD